MPSLQARPLLCSSQIDLECHKALLEHNLFNSKAKLVSNYLPILALRALAHADVYKNKKSFRLERFFYMKNNSGNYEQAYEEIVLDGSIEPRGLFGRAITLKGKLNDFDLWYQNIMTASLPRNLFMDVVATLDDVKILELEIHSDGIKMTNNVKGHFFGQKIQYSTEMRDSNGILAGQKYRAHTIGENHKCIEFNTEGSFGDINISGEGKMLAPSQYETVEYYGPIMVKTFVKIKD